MEPHKNTNRILLWTWIIKESAVNKIIRINDATDDTEFKFHAPVGLVSQTNTVLQIFWDRDLYSGRQYDQNGNTKGKNNHENVSLQLGDSNEEELIIHHVVESSRLKSSLNAIPSVKLVVLNRPGLRIKHKGINHFSVQKLDSKLKKSRGIYDCHFTRTTNLTSIHPLGFE